MRFDSADILERVASVIGPLGSEMLDSRTTTERNLGHPDPNVRAVAIHLLTHKWADDADVNSTCEKALNEDKDPTVQAAALCCLGIYNAGSKDRRLGKILSAIVKNECEDTYVRESAYRALFHLSNKQEDFQEPEEVLAAIREIRIPDDVDWKLVDSFS
jgi:hypothetical protein